MLTTLQPSTWHALGLGVAANWAILGLSAMTWPHRTAALFGCGPENGSTSAALAGTNMPADANKSADGTDDDGGGAAAVDVPGLVTLVGCRDLTFSAALFALGYNGRTREMGTVILSTMVVCAVDVFVVWRRRKLSE
jgi:hypothetical protein